VGKKGQKRAKKGKAVLSGFFEGVFFGFSLHNVAYLTYQTQLKNHKIWSTYNIFVRLSSFRKIYNIS
jgi:hypothetical protein